MTYLFVLNFKYYSDDSFEIKEEVIKVFKTEASAYNFVGTLLDEPNIKYSYSIFDVNLDTYLFVLNFKYYSDDSFEIKEEVIKVFKTEDSAYNFVGTLLDEPNIKYSYSIFEVNLND